ncbi:MAG: hydrogenase subunit MbhD domain-containing protein [Clostridium sp.]
MMIFETILLTFLLVCAIAVSLTKNLLSSVVIFMSYSLIVSVLWLLLRSPDLAITEAAVGAGITSTLFFVTLQNVKKLKDVGEEKDSEE